MKKVYYWVFAAILICGTTAVSLSLTSCNEAQKGMPLAVQHPEIPLD